MYNKFNFYFISPLEDIQIITHPHTQYVIIAVIVLSVFLCTVEMCMKFCKDGMRIAVKRTTVINLTTWNSTQKVKYEGNDSTTIVDSFAYDIHIETHDNHLKLFIKWKRN